MSTPSTRPAYILAGATATGKTRLAHRIAREQGWAICSADSMLVYRGMDIGTAKPSADERSGLLYGGIDLVAPSQFFSVGAYVDHVHRFLTTLPPKQPVLIVGGTGLYIKALVVGLDPMPACDPAVRDAVRALHEREGLKALQDACEREAPDRFASLKDRDNPRRVMRALELARMQVPPEGRWQEARASLSGVALMPDRVWLHARIADRVERMYQKGFLAEVRGLCEAYPSWSPTAAMAIGYREARAVIEGTLPETTAREETVGRTRRYAKRQTTWLRHQLPLTLCDVSENIGEDVLLKQIYEVWNTHGPCIIGN